MTRNKVWEVHNLESITIYDALYEHPRFRAFSNLLGSLAETDDPCDVAIPDINHQDDSVALDFCYSIFLLAREYFDEKDNPTGIISAEEWSEYKLSHFYLISGIVDKYKDGYHVLGSDTAFLPMMKGR